MTKNHTVQDGAHRSKYTFTETPDGFVVRGEGRVPARVTLRPTHFSVTADDGGPFYRDQHEEMVGFYHCDALLGLLSWILLRDWESAADKGKRFPDSKERVGRQTAAAIRNRLYRQRRRLLTEVDPIVLGVQRSIFAATRAMSSIALSEELYRHKDVVDDIINCRAAAIAAVHVHTLAHLQANVRPGLRSGATQLDRQIQRLLRVEDDPSIETNPFSHSERSDVTLQLLNPIYIGLMDNWRDLFSDTGKAYESLDRTLTNLPPGITFKGLRNLPRLHLERPHTERLELMVLLMYGQSQSQQNMHVFQHARVPDIKRAMRQVTEATGLWSSPRRPLTVKFTVDYLAAYPEKHSGNIVGLAQRAIKWHREVINGQA